MLFFAGCQLIAMGIISEYLGRTLEQVKGRPIYILREAVGFAPASPAANTVPAPHLSRSRPFAGETAGRTPTRDPGSIGYPDA
ncbi:MAG: hypothetical protein WKF75_11825 [Singulisphaera sp.]